jgi:hypothetical protein
MAALLQLVKKVIRWRGQHQHRLEVWHPPHSRKPGAARMHERQPEEQYKAPVADRGLVLDG